MITLVNKFTVAGSPQEFEQAWEASSEFMREQPGFVAFRLMRSLGDPQVYINVAEWTDAESHARVLRSEGFQAHIAQLAGLAKPEPNVCETVFDSRGTAG